MFAGAFAALLVWTTAYSARPPVGVIPFVATMRSPTLGKSSRQRVLSWGGRLVLSAVPVRDDAGSTHKSHGSSPFSRPHDSHTSRHRNERRRSGGVVDKMYLMVVCGWVFLILWMDIVSTRWGKGEKNRKTEKVAWYLTRPDGMI